MAYTPRKPVRRIFQTYYARRGVPADVRAVRADIDKDGNVDVTLFRIPTRHDFDRGRLRPTVKYGISSRKTLFTNIALSNETAYYLWLTLDNALFPKEL